jgi:uncharacterized protein (DUF433 family)
MPRYPLSLPKDLKREAEVVAKVQGVSLNQFILWAVSEKLGALKQQMDDPSFPRVTYRRGASGVPTAVLRGTGIRVQTLVVAHQNWKLAPREVARQFGIGLNEVKEALSFYEEHREEIDRSIASEESLAGSRG